MKWLLLLLMLFSEYTSTPAESQNDSTGKQYLIINSFDAYAIKARKNKEELYAELTDSLKLYLQESPALLKSGKISVLPVMIADTSLQHIQLLMQNAGANRAIVILNLDVYFENTGTHEYYDSDGKRKKIKNYDLCCKVLYGMYDMETARSPILMSFCQFFTSRHPASGLLATGPDIVAKKKYTFPMVKENVRRLLDEYGPFN
ncbi:MAG: hypothetical protein IPP93_17260 [Chitinophagaceae bacterium]|nr:hypothetical protein [Chitinophagaceae bacterium]